MSAGNAGNVVPDSATLRGTIRSYDERTRTSAGARTHHRTAVQASLVVLDVLQKKSLR